MRYEAINRPARVARSERGQDKGERNARIAGKQTVFEGDVPLELDFDCPPFDGSWGTLFFRIRSPSTPQHPLREKIRRVEQKKRRRNRTMEAH